MSMMEYVLQTDDWKTYSVSRCKHFIGLFCTDSNGKALTGEKRLPMA